MSDALFLAWRYLKFHWVKTLLLILSLSLILFIPFGLSSLTQLGIEKMTQRAEDTPLLIGAKGSPTELVLSALYFKETNMDGLTYSDLSNLSDQALVSLIPMRIKFKVKDLPIVGTNTEYFSFRGTSFIAGRPMATLGECVLGHSAAANLEVTINESIISSPSGAFDVAGVFPLKMKVVGILNPTGTKDDEAVFVDLKTSWVISGFSHGHENITNMIGDSLVLSKTDTMAIVSPAILSYTEITNENIDSFHFHGNPDNFPIDAILVNPKDKKSALIFQGRLENSEGEIQILKPSNVIADLISTVVSVKNLLILAAAVIGLATFFILYLVFALSIQLRKPEIQTLKWIGGDFKRIDLILSIEIAITLIISILLSFIFTITLKSIGLNMIESFLT